MFRILFKWTTNPPTVPAAQAIMTQRAMLYGRLGSGKSGRNELVRWFASKNMHHNSCCSDMLWSRCEGFYECKREQHIQQRLLCANGTGRAFGLSSTSAAVTSGSLCLRQFFVQNKKIVTSKREAVKFKQVILWRTRLNILKVCNFLCTHAAR
jgi:hypothetical protein